MSTLFLMDRGWRPFARLPPAARLGTGRSREGLIPSLRLSELAAFILLPMYYAQLRPAVPVGNLRSEILVVQSAQNWHRQRATDSLDGTGDRRVLVQR